MKKKIINGIMMVALVAATSTSFVSCKDTNEDVRIEQAAEIAALKGRLTTLESQYGDLDGRVSALNTKVDNLEDRVDNHALAIETLQKEVDELEVWLAEAFAKLVTSVEISGTYNNMTGSINIPGFEPKMLINNYGVAAQKCDAWPKSDIVAKEDKLAWAANEELGTGKSAEELSGFAGYIYANVNRYLDDVPLQDKSITSKVNTSSAIFDLSLVNTAGAKAEGVVIVNDDVEGGPTKDVLQWGWTRADNNIFKFRVNYVGEKASDFQPAKIDLKVLKDDLKAVWRDRNRYSGTSKQSLGRLLADLYYNYATKDTNMKKYALKIAWEDNTSGEYGDDDEYVYNADTEKIDFTENNAETAGLKHMVTSEAELVFATIKPLGFNSGDALAEKVHSVTTKTNSLIERAEPYMDRILNRVKNQLKIDKLNLPEDAFEPYYDSATNKYYLTIKKATLVASGLTTATGDLQVDITDMAESITKSFGNVNDFVANMKSLMGKVNGTNIGNWVEKFTNRFDKLFTNNADQMLQPVLLAINKEGTVNRVSGLKEYPYEVEGEVRLEPTTYTAELMAPCYAKFVGCKDITADNFNTIIIAGAPTKAQQLKFTPEKGKLYEIVYEAVDFFGNTFEHTYYIQGK